MDLNDIPKYWGSQLTTWQELPATPDLTYRYRTLQLDLILNYRPGIHWHTRLPRAWEAKSNYVDKVQLASQQGKCRLRPRQWLPHFISPQHPFDRYTEGPRSLTETPQKDKKETIKGHFTCSCTTHTVHRKPSSTGNYQKTW